MAERDAPRAGDRGADLCGLPPGGEWCEALPRRCLDDPPDVHGARARLLANLGRGARHGRAGAPLGGRAVSGVLPLGERRLHGRPTHRLRGTEYARAQGDPRRVLDSIAALLLEPRPTARRPVRDSPAERLRRRWGGALLWPRIRPWRGHVPVGRQGDGGAGVHCRKDPRVLLPWNDSRLARRALMARRQPAPGSGQPPGAPGTRTALRLPRTSRRWTCAAASSPTPGSSPRPGAPRTGSGSTSARWASSARAPRSRSTTVRVT